MSRHRSMPSPLPRSRWLGIGVALVVAQGSACTLLLDPERTDDVDRCRYDDDCPLADDPRYELYCTVSEEYQDQELDFPRICAPRTAVSCDPRSYAFDSSIATRFREATAQLDRYDEHCSKAPGVQGCSPAEDGCAGGLSQHDASRRCDDTDPMTPPAIGAEPLVKGQDVLDQFCRAMYCDIGFACRASDYRCVPCVPGEPLGRGGCGDLYFDGERSTAYQDPGALEGECGGPDMNPEDVFIGPVEREDLGRRD